MTTRSILIALLFVPALLLSPLHAAEFTIETIGAPPSEGVSDTLRAMLHGEGVRVKGPDGKVVGEYWGRKQAFSGDPVSGYGIRFETIPEGAVVGLVHFPENASDFREQRVPAGIYTLRYSLHPEDGNHMGVAPSRDFVALIAVADDAEPEKDYSFDDLSDLSMKIGNPHPAIARAEMAEGDGSPNIWQNDMEYWLIDLKVVEEPMGIVVYGHSEE
jgi:hypothetical protein